MAKRTQAQKIGSRGSRILSVIVEEHPHWLVRDLTEDFGIDLEFELTESGVNGEIVKVQVKSAETVERSAQGVRASIDAKYLRLASTCRYPLIFTLVDVSTKEAWYVWLQDWLLKGDPSLRERMFQQDSWTHWIPEGNTVQRGLDAELKSIAKWEGESQLVLSLIDALRSAVSIHHPAGVPALITLIESIAPQVSDSSLQFVVEQAVRLGERLRGTAEGNLIADQLFALVRKVGGRVAYGTVLELVLRDDSYSRTGLTALGILYDEHPAHITKLQLAERLTSTHPEVAFYCAWREAFPDAKSSDPFSDPGDFVFAGLSYRKPDMHWDKYANRGPSALLDYLEMAEQGPTDD